DGLQGSNVPLWREAERLARGKTVTCWSACSSPALTIVLPSAKLLACCQASSRLLQASRILLVANNVVIAREAARAQAAYRCRGGRRDVLIPDFVIGANALHYAGRLLTTNPRDFFRAQSLRYYGR